MTLKERQLIIIHHQNGKSIRQRVEIIQRSYSAIQHIIERRQNDHQMVSKFGAVPKKKLLLLMRSRSCIK